MNPQVDPTTGLEVLDDHECFGLLERSALGRLAVVLDGQPLIFPVNFTVDGNTIVLRTDVGTKLHGARNGPVAFECDGSDAVYHTGWSVLATGVAEEVRDRAEVEHLEHLPLGPWCPGPHSTWLRIRPTTLTGRRIPLHGHVRVHRG